MKRILTPLFIFCVALAVNAQPAPASGPLTLRADNVDEVVAALTLEEKVHLVIGCGMAMGDDVKFPGTTVAATFDPDAAYRVGQALGTEVKDYGLDVLLAPGANLMRNTLCGRNHEYYAEDPVLVGKIAAYINGIQSEGTGTCLKHFAVNNQETNRNNNDSRLTQRPLRELYLKCFEIAVKEAKPWSIMTAYNRVNGKYTCEDRELTEDILRDEWGFEGLVVSDWNAGQDAVASIAAGNDMLQPGQERQYKAILEAVKGGTLDEAFLDLSVKRVLQFVLKSHTFAGYDYPNETDLKAHARLDREVGAEGIVLLDNNGALPLADEQKRLFPNGRPPFSFKALPRAEEFLPTAGELAAQVRENDIAVLTLGRVSGEGCDRRVEEFLLKENERALIEQVSAAYRAAGKKLVVILNVCSPVETASWKGLADAVVCAFQPGQEVGNSIADVLTGKVNPGGKLPMTWAVKYGDAPSDANFPFDYEFRMPSFAMGTGVNFQSDKKEEKPKEPERNVDYTLYEEGIYVGYRYFDTFGKEVSYPFGHGLSYTTFEYTLEESAIDGDRCRVKVGVKNTGRRAGREAVQLYVKAPRGGMDKPAKELKAFGKTRLLQPGESQTLTLEWDVTDMASYNEKASAWELAKGEYQWMVAASSTDVRCTAVQKVAKARKQKTHNAMKAQAPVAVHPMVKR